MRPPPLIRRGAGSARPTAARGPARAAMVAVALGVAGATSAGAAEPGGANPVVAARAEIVETVDVVRLSGTVTSPRVARVSAAVGGLVSEMAVEVGDRVLPGDVLARLDGEVERHSLDRARAATREAEAELADAERELRIGRRLLTGSSLPQNAFEAREARVRIAAAVADRLRAEEALQDARVRRHAVAAPFEGVVSRRAAEAGEWVSPGTMIVELVAIRNLTVDVPVPEVYFPRIAGLTGGSAEFEALPGREFPVLVDTVVPVSDPASRTFLLRLTLEREGPALTTGSAARVTLNLATGETGVAVPRDAVTRYPDGRVSVWVLRGDEPSPVVDERFVELGRSFRGLVQVRDGLQAGERVVVRGNETLRPGQRVRLNGGGA